MIDGFGRSIELMRISVTDRCNYRCVYCMPPEGVQFIPHQKILRYEEIVKVVEAAIRLGIHKFRVTGGEPLVRPGIVDLVRMLARLPGIEDLSLTTNGALLAPLAQSLADAGLMRINVSLDTVDPVEFSRITRGGNLNDVLAGIDAAIQAGLSPVKLNIVVFPDHTDDHARAVEAYAAERGLITRRIHQMDIVNGVFSVVENSDRGNCQVCNRLRLTSDGYIRSCLLHDTMFDVRTLGPEEAIRQAIRHKPEHGCFTRNAYMGRIGG